jgi:predicted transcriptional regulator
MALVVYPTIDYDSLVSLADANTIIDKYSVNASIWNALDDTTKEKYLRIATDRVLSVIDITLLDGSECIKKAVSLIANKDVSFGISSDINPNLGTITKEKVGDLEVEYKQTNGAKGKDRNPFPVSTYACLNNYGANIQSGRVRTFTIERS